MLKTTAGAVPGLVHERFLPADDLAAHVEHYWLVSWDFRDRQPHPVATLPHPSVHMIFEAGDRGGVAGPARARFSRELSGAGRVFAVKFRPGGFRPFTDGPVSRFTDKVVSLAEVFATEGEHLEQGVLSATASDQRIALVEHFLRCRRPAPDATVERVAELVYSVVREPDIVKVQDLAAKSGLGLRTLQRLFAEYVGVGPKWVIQRYRLHEAAERLASGPVDQATLALEIGYSDQAHFIRDFKAMVGVTPAVYAREEGRGHG